MEVGSGRCGPGWRGWTQLDLGLGHRPTARCEQDHVRPGEQGPGTTLIGPGPQDERNRRPVLRSLHLSGRRQEGVARNRTGTGTAEWSEGGGGVVWCGVGGADAGGGDCLTALALQCPLSPPASAEGGFRASPSLVPPRHDSGKPRRTGYKLWALLQVRRACTSGRPVGGGQVFLGSRTP